MFWTNAILLPSVLTWFAALALGTFPKQRMSA
jgi:hypothetical protein